MSVCWLAQFSKLFLVLCSQQPCELGSIAPICEIRKLRTREAKQPLDITQLMQEHGNGGNFRTRSNFPFAGIQGEPLWSGTVDRKIPWARGVPVVHMPRGGVTQERQSVWEAAGLPWRKDSPHRSLPSIPSVSLSCSLCQIAGT